MLEDTLGRVIAHVDKLDQVRYALDVIQDKDDPKVLHLLHNSVKDLCSCLADGAAMGLEVNREMSALMEARERELDKLTKPDT